jgi:hypothetical protein
MTLNIAVPFGDRPKTILRDSQDVQNLIPIGWQLLAEEMWFAFQLMRVSKQDVLTFRIEKGLLRFEIESELTSETDRKLINRICQSIASSSARICMECEPPGKHGFRRKNEQGWPCLCTTHYIEYATQLTNQENG